MNVRLSEPSRLRIRDLSTGAIILSLFMGLLAGCAQPKAKTTGPFLKVESIDEDLKRGVSTKSDVERVLGRPNGKGETLMPPTQTRRGDVWTYYNSHMGKPRVSAGRTSGTTRVDLDSRDQMIVIFFDGDKFDGYLWFLQVSTGGGKVR